MEHLLFRELKTSDGKRVRERNKTKAKKKFCEIIYENFMVYIFFVVHMIVATATTEHRMVCSNNIIIMILCIFFCGSFSSRV